MVTRNILTQVDEMRIVWTSFTGISETYVQSIQSINIYLLGKDVEVLDCVRHIDSLMNEIKTKLINNNAMNQKILDLIEHAIQTRSKSRVYFRTTMRDPIYGTFVRENDYKEKISKGWIRFVPEGKWDIYVNSLTPIVHTKLFQFGDFLEIKNYENAY